ncbi:MAG TPA: glycosyltransferase [Steroidobacteraceae bacterium]|nr:glycosyltransferase [Steroidobacteraceae bacterium]
MAEQSHIDEAHRAALPRTAVVICTHNGERFVREQLDSIDAQNLPVEEIHVFDWNSTDGTMAKVRQWAANREPRRMIAIHEAAVAPGPALSFLQALQSVLRSSAADLILLADQDDIWAVDKVQALVDEYRGARAGFDMAFSDVRVLRADGSILPTFYGPGSPYRRPGAAFDSSILLTNPVIGMTLCLRREWLLRVQAALDLHWIMHDWALAILCWLTSARLRYLDRPLVTYRQHTANTLGAWTNRSMLNRARGVRRHVRNVRGQLQSVRSAARLLGVPAARIAEVAELDGRFGQAKAAARSTLLSARYRFLVALSLLYA